jgi:DNA-binding transcriptional LysR family regulator
MEIRRLSYFMRVAEDGSLVRAAGILRIAQPALSRQMRLLEEELGVKLFHRTARGMRLTEDGEQLRASIAGPIRELQLALDNIRSARSEGNLVIGLPPGLADLLALPLAMKIDADFPGTMLRIIEGPSGSLVDWLNRGLVDLALLEEISRDNRLEDRLLAEQPLRLIGPPGQSPSSAIPFAEAAQLPLVVPSHHLGIKGAIDDAATRARATLNVRLHADSPRLVRDLVASGKGFGLLPEAYCRKDVADGRLSARAITEPEPVIGIYLSSRRNTRINRGRLGEIEETVAALIRACVAGPDGRQVPTTVRVL